MAFHLKNLKTQKDKFFFINDRTTALRYGEGWRNHELYQQGPA